MSQNSFGVFINDDWKVNVAPDLERRPALRGVHAGQGAGQPGHELLPRPRARAARQRHRPAVQDGQEQLRSARRPGVGREGRRQDQRARRVRADLRRARRSASVHPGLFSTPTLGVFRVSLAQTPRFAPDSRWRPASIPTTRPPAATTSACSRACRSSAPRRPARRRSTSSSVPDDFQLGHYHYYHLTLQREVLRNNSVTVSYVGSRGTGPGVAQGDQRAAARLADDEPGLAAAVPLAVPAVPQHHRVHQRQPSRGTTACSSRSGRTRGTASTRSTTTRCRSAPTTTRATATRPTRRRPIPYDPADNKGPCDFDIRHNFNVGGSYEIPGASIGGGPLQIGAVFTALSGRPFTSGQGTTDNSGQEVGRDPRQLPGRARSTTGISTISSRMRTRPARRSPTRRRHSAIRRRARSAPAAATAVAAPASPRST